MALLGPSFQTGRSALAAYQSALAIVGQNIANVGNPNYTRLSGRLTPQLGGPTLGGVAPGAGVRLSHLNRHIDESIESQLRLAIATRSGADVRRTQLSRVESLYNELTEQDLSTQLTQFFSSFGEVQTAPADGAPRQGVLVAADAMVRTIRRQRSGLLTQISDLNQLAVEGARRAGEIAREIAQINQQVVSEEARGQSVSGPLRDRRDTLLKELADYMNVQVREQPNGSVNVYVGSQPLVEFNRSRGLTTQIELVDGYERASIRFADDQSSVVLRAGKLAGIVETRDVHLVNQLDRLDGLARGLIREVNQVHGQGRGLTGYSSMQSAHFAANPAAPLGSTAAGLPFPVQNGTMIVHVRDPQTGQEITRQIEIDLDGIGSNDTTLETLANDLDEVPGLNAFVGSDGRLNISGENGQQFWFTEDSSGVLSAVGIGAFFTGTDAATIDVSADLRRDPGLIAASASGAINDGDNAGLLAVLGDRASGLLGGVGLHTYHSRTISELAVSTAAALGELDASDTVFASLTAQRESISGVSLDEEAINLQKFERAFQGATRYLTVLDSLADEVLSLVR
ncbi:MAG: flagellar hook-associated protein FlgK [Planctomycetia bacterium]|nr:MAG: flagellar hook-associated protein FlgK [Planctomycetia bacterium]